MMFRLSLNTGFAVNRYSEPREWLKILGKDCGVHFAQLTADLINPSLPDVIIDQQILEIQEACSKYDVTISSTFTGGFTRVNHMAHPDASIRAYWIEWFKRFADISKRVGSTNMGSHFGIFTHFDNSNPELRAERRQQNIEGWHEVARYAKSIGLEYLSWEPMSISREQGENQVETRRLQNDVNRNSPLPFFLCLDVDHGDVTSKNPDDTDPYSWLSHFAKDSPLIHLKQSCSDKSGHFPFTKEYNDKGKILPDKVINTLLEHGRDDADLILELSFREREPADSQVIEVLKQSTEYWKRTTAARLE